MPEKILVAFDFDHTIVDENSDHSVIKLAPCDRIPDQIQKKYSPRAFIDYMSDIFNLLHENGITKEDILKCIQALPFTIGFIELFQYLKDTNFEVIILSDSNSEFIKHFIDNANIASVVHVVYSNPAFFDSFGCLQIQRYHQQTWCKISTENLCKGHILQEHIRTRAQDGVEFKHVVYVGDGLNDLCPALILRQMDFICPRKDFKLWKEMQRLGLLTGNKSEMDLKANIVTWESGIDLIHLLRSLKTSMPQSRAKSGSCQII